MKSEEKEGIEHILKNQYLSLDTKFFLKGEILCVFL